MKIRLKLKEKYRTINTLSSVPEISDLVPLTDSIFHPNPDSPIITTLLSTHGIMSETKPLSKSETSFISNLLSVHEPEPLPGSLIVIDRSPIRTSSPKLDSSTILDPKINLDTILESDNISTIITHPISIIDTTVDTESVNPAKLDSTIITHPISIIDTTVDTEPVNPTKSDSIVITHLISIIDTKPVNLTKLDSTIITHPISIIDTEPVNPTKSDSTVITHPISIIDTTIDSKPVNPTKLGSIVITHPISIIDTKPVNLTKLDSTIITHPISIIDTEPINPTKSDSTVITHPVSIIDTTIDSKPVNPTKSDSTVITHPISIIDTTIDSKPVNPTKLDSTIITHPISIIDTTIDTKPVNPTKSDSIIAVTKPETNMEKIIRFQKLPNYKQKSKTWLKQRDNYLTASTIAAAAGVMGPAARTNLLLNKVSHGAISNFNGNTATHWGNKYEPVANGIYAYRNNVKIYNFGMITNTQYPILGVSPDGITEQTMLEIKCPWSRVIDGKIKIEYFHQMQEQMVVCEFNKCDFLECRFEEVSEMRFWDDFCYYNNKENINREKGIIIVYINLIEEEIDYLYSPIDYYTNLDRMRDWQRKTIDDLRRNDKTLYLFDSYWYLTKYNCQMVHRDPHWIKEYYPVLQAFWKEVEYYREKGIDCLLEKINKEKNFKKTGTPQITKFFNSKDNPSTPSFRKKKTKCLL